MASQFEAMGNIVCSLLIALFILLYMYMYNDFGYGALMDS